MVLNLWNLAQGKRKAGGSGCTTGGGGSDDSYGGACDETTIGGVAREKKSYSRVERKGRTESRETADYIEIGSRGEKSRRGVRIQLRVLSGIG